MKFIFALMTILPFMASASTLTLKVSVKGKKLTEFNQPTVTFQATSKLCLRAILLPMPAVYMKTVKVPGHIKSISDDTLEITLPTAYPEHVCDYKFLDATISTKKQLEYISVVSLKASHMVSDAAERDLLSPEKASFEVEHSNGLSRVLKNGSQSGYGNSNVGYLYVNDSLLSKNSSASFTISFR